MWATAAALRRPSFVGAANGIALFRSAEHDIHFGVITATPTHGYFPAFASATNNCSRQAGRAVPDSS